MRITMCFVTVLIASPMNAQNTGICSIVTSGFASAERQKGWAVHSNTPADAILLAILQYHGLDSRHGNPPNFMVVSSHHPDVKGNVRAKLCPDGQRYIFFDPDFVLELHGASPRDWAVKGTFAHEVGHHLHNHDLDGKGDQRELELDADTFSGYTLARMGAGVGHALIFVDREPPYATDTHPGRCTRRVAIIDGYNEARRQMRMQEYEISNNCDPVLPAPAAQQAVPPAASPGDLTSPWGKRPRWPNGFLWDELDAGQTWWRRVEPALLDTDGEKYFEANVQGRAIPRIQGQVELFAQGQVCVEIGYEFRLGSISCDVWLPTSQLPHLAFGSRIEFQGIAERFARSLDGKHASLYLKVRPEDIRVIDPGFVPR